MWTESEVYIDLLSGSSYVTFCPTSQATNVKEKDKHCRGNEVFYCLLHLVDN